MIIVISFQKNAPKNHSFSGIHWNTCKQNKRRRGPACWWESIVGVNGKGQFTLRRTYVSHGFSGEKVDVLSFSEVWDLPCGCQTTTRHKLHWSSIIFPLPPLCCSPPPPMMWRLIFTLKAQHSHVTQLPGPQPSVYIATCQGWIQIQPIKLNNSPLFLSLQ